MKIPFAFFKEKKGSYVTRRYPTFKVDPPACTSQTGCSCCPCPVLCVDCPGTRLQIRRHLRHFSPSFALQCREWGFWEGRKQVSAWGGHVQAEHNHDAAGLAAERTSPGALSLDFSQALPPNTWNVLCFHDQFWSPQGSSYTMWGSSQLLDSDSIHAWKHLILWLPLLGHRVWGQVST